MGSTSENAAQTQGCGQFPQSKPVDGSLDECRRSNAFVRGVSEGNRVGKLISLAEERPFLREVRAENVVAVRKEGRGTSERCVLNDAELLIVSFFNEK